MVVRTADALVELFEADETAWLETMADLIQNRRLEQLDYSHLQEYLCDMAKRDKREVQSRLATLMAHILRWRYQPDNQTGSWKATILEQTEELEALLESGVLRNHAMAVFNDAYAKAVKRASAETGLPKETFPMDCPFTLDFLLVGAATDERQ